MAEALGRLRRPPRWISFAPDEDAFTLSAAPERRREVAAIARRVLARGIDLSITTRAGLREGEALVALARRFGGRLAVRVGVFSHDDGLVARWEPGLAPTRARLALAGALKAAGADVTIELGPIIPFVNDDARKLGALVRQIARTGVDAIVPRWIEDSPGLLGQVQREVSRSASRMLGGWLGQPGSQLPGGRRVLPLQVRRPRRQQLIGAVRGLNIRVIECRCVHEGASLACPSAPRGADDVQLDLFQRGA